MYRATGPGKVKEYGDQPYPVIKASLYNFDFDDKKVKILKKEHIQWLEQNGGVVPLLLGGNASIWMRGSASRVGADQYNMELSKIRVNRVAAYLRRRGVRDNQMRLDWCGERCSISPNEDDPEDRAVLLRCQPVLPEPIPPPQPPPEPPPPPVTQFFKIRMLGGVEASKFVSNSKFKRAKDLLKVKVGPTVDILFFEIRDDKNELSSFYIYGGGGLGIGGYWLSATHKGPPNYFQTSSPIAAFQFEGFAHFTTGGVYKWTKNALHMYGTPEGVDPVHLIDLRTGATVGAGLSKTLGYLCYIDSARGPTAPW